MKVGVVIGKFYPFHKGHEYMIKEASKHVERLYVLPCFTDGETIPIQVRQEWVQDFVDNNRDDLFSKEVIVDKVIDQLPSSSDGRTSDYKVSEAWAKYLKNRFPDLTHFIGSEPYIEMMADAVGADSIIVDLDRTNVPISATKIRNNFEDRKEKFLSPKVIQEYVKRVCIIGIESSGKSTLTKALGDILGVPTVEEYGRTYCLINSPLDDMKDYFLTRKDFHNIAIGHNRLVLHAYKEALKKNKSLILVDTDHVITQCFFKRYIDSKGDKKIQDMCNFQEYDLYLWVDPVPFEDDGTRRIVDEKERTYQKETVLREFRQTKPKAKVINVKGTTVAERIESAIKILSDHDIIPKLELELSHEDPLFPFKPGAVQLAEMSSLFISKYKDSLVEKELEGSK